MLIKKYRKKGYDFVELRQGIDGIGKPIYLVATQRPGKNRRKVYWQEAFKSRKEAERWVKTIWGKNGKIR